LRYSWDNSARQFIGHAHRVARGGARDAATVPAITEPTNDINAPNLVPRCNTGISHENSA
jgi:hypothetical protein